MSEKAVEELRGAYNQFVRSACGADFLSKLVAYELNLTAQAMLESEHQKKAQAIDKASGIQWVRTLIQDLSKPAPRPPSLKRSRNRV